MWPYFVLFFIVAVPAFMSVGQRLGQQRPRLLLVTTLALTLAIGLRLEVGGDWFVYLRIFNYTSNTNLWSALSAKTSDPAYGFLNWVAGQLGAGIWFVNLVCATIFMLGLRALCRQQTNPALAMLIAVPYMCIVIAMGYTRQSVALGLTMWALARFQERKFLRFAILMVVAPTFHKSAVIVFSLFAFASAKNKIMTLGAVTLLAVGVYSLFLQSSVDTLVTNYIKTGYSSGGAGIRIGMNLLPAVLLFALRNRLPFREGERRIWLVFAIGVLVSSVFFVLSPSSTAVDRAALYLFPLQIAILSRLPDIPNRSGTRSMVLVNVVILYSLAIMTTWLLYGNATFTWLPYRNYLWIPSGFVPSHHRF